MYNYYEALSRDIRAYIDEEIDFDEWRGDREGLETELNDVLWSEDSVTGKSSGSYTCNSWRAEENICHNLDLLAEALNDLGEDMNYLLDHGAEAADVIIRCYLLSSVISEVLDDYYTYELYENEEEDCEEAVEQGDKEAAMAEFIEQLIEIVV